MSETDENSNTTRTPPVYFQNFKRWIRFLFQCTSYLINNLFGEVHAMEQMFIAKMSNIYILICQLLFFTMCEMAMLRSAVPNAKRTVTGLTTLLFYSVFGYFVGRIQDICRSNWSHRSHTSYTTCDYIKWVLRIIIEWAKVFIIVLCLKEQGMSYRPQVVYTLVTFAYYLCTEQLFVKKAPILVKYFDFDVLESMEHLYVPIALHLYSVLAAVTVGIYLLSTPQALYALFASYFTFYIRLKDLYCNYIKVAASERRAFASFRPATLEDIQKWNDICAVCLNRMSKARITPCKHLFHSQCLKQCLQSSYQCPLCKHDFMQ